MLQDLRQGPLFAAMPEDQVQCVLEQGSECVFQTGEVIFNEGDPALYFYVLLEGNIQITKRVGAQETTLALHTQPGAFTGEIPLLTGTPYVATALMIKAGKVLCYSAATFRRLLTLCPGMLSVILNVLVTRIQNTARNHWIWCNLYAAAPGSPDQCIQCIATDGFTACNNRIITRSIGKK
jgi:CRP-like cAMP-binding protein